MLRRTVLASSPGRTAEHDLDDDSRRAPRAWFSTASGGILAEQLVDWSDDPAVLDRGGWWAVVITFEGAVRLWRFATHRPARRPAPRRPWQGVPGPWTTSLDRSGYVDRVEAIRDRIRDGEVYQVNLCRVVSAALPQDADPWALADVLATGNPAPHAAVIDLPATAAPPHGGGLPATTVVCASPELFLSRDGDLVTSSPIKGTASTSAGLQPKDTAENVMIVDLVRNDLQRVCRPGTVEVTGLLELEQHPGLVHLVSTVRGRLSAGTGWVELLAATLPPGSVSGAPKISAVATIAAVEPRPRGPYCGAIGWVDADAGTACLAVAIRTFWWQDGRLEFGTGAGITWGSEPQGEWAETELKAARLVGLAGRAGLAGQEGRR